ncbi:hypothetical protein [Acrocarpospora sp. B8E8]|uniref:hypothetical protein n=1 Tax=Acrocarpospora sp. B8E8 TaxID=3153572 RepID=UPI00325FD3F6
MTSGGENNTIYVQPGRAIIQGFHYYLDETKALAVSSNLDGSSSRIDSVVLRLNRSSNTITVAVVEGTPAATPAEPALDVTAPVWELRLANLIVTAGAQAVDPAGVLDRRPFVGKRIHTTTNPAGLDVGSIAFNPADGQFYGVTSAATATAFPSMDSLDQAAGAVVAAHAAQADPHPAYLTPARGDDRYSPLAHTHTGGAAAQTFTYCYQGTLAPGAGTFRVYNDSPAAYTILSCRASVATAPTGAACIFDINLNGTTIFAVPANRPTIAVAATTSGKNTAMSVTSWPPGGFITVDIDQVGSAIAGADLILQLIAA